MVCVCGGVLTGALSLSFQGTGIYRKQPQGDIFCPKYVYLLINSPGIYF